MNGSGIPFSATGDSPRRGSAHHPSNMQTSIAENNSHRPTRVHFPDNGTGSEAFPRIRGADSEFDLHPFHGDSRRTGLVDTIVGFFAFFLTIVCLCGLMAIMVILYLTVRPFSVNVYRRLSAHIGMSTFLDAMSLLLPDTRLIVTGDSDITTPIGASLFVCNHLLDGDYWALIMLGRCIGFTGTMKAFLRNEYLQINLDDVDQGSRQSPSPTSSSIHRNTAGGQLMMSNQSSRSVPAQSQQITPSSNNGSGTICSSTIIKSQPPPSDLKIVAKLLHLFFEFPLLNGEESGSSDREKLFSLLRSLAADNAAATAPVHLILFPEGWSTYKCGVSYPFSETRESSSSISEERKAILAKSNEFAKREGKPQLQCLLQPRTRVFNASLECLRESNPFVYDVTMAYTGYNGSLPHSIQPLSIPILFFDVLRKKFPKEIHIRIKRYSMEEVLHIDNVNWLVKKWAEKDRLLTYFARHQQFPNDSRGFYGRPRVFNTRFHSLESSVGSLIRLILVTSAVPVLVLVSVPLSWTVLWIWVVTKACQLLVELISGREVDNGSGTDPGAGGRFTPGSVPSAAGTPYLPATPFVSPNLMNWKQLFSSGENKRN